MWVNILLKAFLFFVLVPGVSVRIPHGASLQTQALIHGIVFALANNYLYHHVRPMFEGFENPDSRVDQPCPPNSVKCPSGDCRLKSDIYGMCD